MSQATDRLTLPWRELIDGFIDGLHRLGPSNSMQYQHQRQLTFFAEYVGADLGKPRGVNCLCGSIRSGASSSARSVRSHFGTFMSGRR